MCIPVFSENGSIHFQELVDKISRFQDLLYNSGTHVQHNNIIQYINIENMRDREGIYFRLIHYIQYTSTFKTYWNKPLMHFINIDIFCSS